MGMEVESQQPDLLHVNLADHLVLGVGWLHSLTTAWFGREQWTTIARETAPRAAGDEEEAVGITETFEITVADYLP